MHPPDSEIGPALDRPVSFISQDASSADLPENGRPTGQVAYNNGVAAWRQRTKSFLSESFPFKSEQGVASGSTATLEGRKLSKDSKRQCENTRATIFRQSSSKGDLIVGDKRMTVRDMEKMVFGPRNTTTRSYADIMPQWHWVRRVVYISIESLLYKIVMAGSIVFNMALLVIETDMRARHKEQQDGTEFRPKSWMDVTTKTLVGVYIVDISLRIYVDRRSFFKGFANVFDLTIVVTDFLLLFMQDDVPSVAVLRVFRIARVVRVLRSFLVFRELYLMMQGLVSAIRAIIFAAFLIFIGLTMWSILAVEFIHSKNVVLNDQNAYGECIRCRVAFSTVMHANLTFMKNIIAGDSWGQMSLPLMETHPETSFIIIAALLTIQLGLLNLIVAVIVDRAAAARADDEELQHTVKMEMLDKSYQRLINLFQAMDTDGSGALSLPELEESYDEHVEFREILNLMDIGRQDLSLVFDILDQNRDEEVSYTEFVEQLHTMKTLEEHTILIFIKHYVNQIHEKADRQLDILDSMTLLLKSQVDEVLTATRALLPEEPAAAGAHAPESTAVSEGPGQSLCDGAGDANAEPGTHSASGLPKVIPLNGCIPGSAALREGVKKLLLSHDEAVIDNLRQAVDESICKVFSVAADKVAAQFAATQSSVPSQSDPITLSNIIPEILEGKAAHGNDVAGRDDLGFSMDGALVSGAIRVSPLPMSRALYPLPAALDRVEIPNGEGAGIPQPKGSMRADMAEQHEPLRSGGVSPTLVGPRFRDPAPSSRIPFVEEGDHTWVPLPSEVQAAKLFDDKNSEACQHNRSLRGPAGAPELPKGPELPRGCTPVAVYAPTCFEAEPQQPAPAHSARPPPQPEVTGPVPMKAAAFQGVTRPRGNRRRSSPTGRGAAEEPGGLLLSSPPALSEHPRAAA